MQQACCHGVWSLAVWVCGAKLLSNLWLPLNSYYRLQAMQEQLARASSLQVVQEQVAGLYCAHTLRCWCPASQVHW